MGGICSSAILVGIIIAESLTSVVPLFFFFLLWVRIRYHLLAWENLTVFQVSAFVSVCIFAFTDLLAFQWTPMNTARIIIYLCALTIRFLMLSRYVHT